MSRQNRRLLCPNSKTLPRNKNHIHVKAEMCELMQKAFFKRKITHLSM